MKLQFIEQRYDNFEPSQTQRQLSLHALPKLISLPQIDKPFNYFM